jgi:hypothetical protein
MNDTPKTKRNPGKRMLGPGYAHALRQFAGPVSWLDLAERCDVSRATAQSIVHAFRRHGLVHVVEWKRVKPGKAQRLTPVCILGAGEDVPHPGVQRAGSSKPTPPELLTFCLMVKAMQADNYHGAGLANLFGIRPKTARGILKALHRSEPGAPNIVAVMDYDHRPRSGPGYPLYGYAPGENDMPKPRRQTKRELWTRHNAQAASRRDTVKLLHAMVRGVSLDGRRRDSTQVQRAA